MRRFIKCFEAMILLVTASSFFVHLVHAAEFNGVEYEMPEGVDLTQEFQLLEKLVVGNTSYNWHGGEHSSDFVEMETLMNQESTKTLWKSRWNIELPEYVEESQHKESIPSNVTVDPRLIRRAIHTNEMAMNPFGLHGYGVRNGCDTRNGDTFYLIALSHSMPERGECILRYLFIGKCVVRDENGDFVYGTRPTGVTFFLNPEGEIIQYHCMKDGKLDGCQIVWNHGKISMETRVCADGLLQNSQPLMEENNTHDIKAYRLSGDGFRSIVTDTTPRKWSVEMEQRLSDANDGWVPWFEGNDSMAILPLSRSFRIAVP